MNSEYINNIILRLCTQPRTFEFISMNLSGFDPVELLSSLQTLEASKRITSVNGLWYENAGPSKTIGDVSSAKSNFFNEHIGFFGLFDKPHPLDFEWRNSTGSLDYLINNTQVLCGGDDKILFLGFPTLFATAFMRNIKQQVTLVERNKSIINRLNELNSNKAKFRIVDADIFRVDPQEIGKHFVVVMDPPWYSPDFYQFMWLAAQCTEVGGLVGISLPPMNTRPGIDHERVEWFSFCQRQGLCLESLHPQKLHYAMPFFEFNAFRAAGVKDILPFWRKGDFALFRKVRDENQERPRLEEKRTEWIEVEIDTVRIRVKSERVGDDPQILKINHLIKGDILPTVSARDKRRFEANVWTTGNRIYYVNDPIEFLRELNEIKNSPTIGSASDYVTNFINTLTGFEKNEHANYLDWLYHEMERQVD